MYAKIIVSNYDKNGEIIILFSILLNLFQRGHSMLYSNFLKFFVIMFLVYYKFALQAKGVKK